MSRVHLFELEDQPWFPSLIRDAGTAYLELMARIARHDETIAPVLARALRRANEDQIVDLCSGGAGPLPSTLARIEADEGRSIPATLTDLYPNRRAFERLARENSNFTARSEPVDATQVPADLKGLRTLFNGLHHFRPEKAKLILGNAVEDRASIAVFEVVARHPLALVGMIFAFFTSFLVVPFLRPFQWRWTLLTYFLPVIPFFIFWDGSVSCLRIYSQDELREMTSSLGAKDYEWEIGALPLFGAPFKGVYLIGTPSQQTPR